MLRYLTRQVREFRAQVDQHRVVVRTAGDHLIALVDEGLCHHGGIAFHLLLIGLELRTQRFAEGHRFGGYHVLERTALRAREDGGVEQRTHLLDLAFRRGLAPRIVEVLAHEDDTAARTAQGLMGRRGHDMRVLQRVVQQTGCDQSGRVGHVDHEYRAYLIGYAADTGVVPFAAVRTRAGDDQLRLMRAGFELQVVVVHAARRFVQVVADSVEHKAREVHGRTVTEVTAVAEVEPHEGVAGFEARHEHRHVRLRTAVRLYVHVLGVIEAFETVAGDILRDVHYLAPAVVAVTGIALGVLVSQHAAHRLHHLVTHEVLTGDQFDTFGLTLPLPADDVKNLCVTIHSKMIYQMMLQRYYKNCKYARKSKKKKRPPKRSLLPRA